VVPEDSAAVAARQVREKKAQHKMAIVFGVGLSIAGSIYAVNFLRETRQALALANRPKQPWDL
jgi:hypothetical protein